MLDKLTLILLLGLITILGIILWQAISTYNQVVQDRIIISSWRPSMINGYYKCPQGLISPLNKAGYYNCGPCLIIVNKSGLNITCPQP